MRPYRDLLGQQFGRLTAIKYAGNSQWHCRCECGNTTKSSSQNLRKGKANSCGCLRDELVSARFRTHGDTDSREFKIWMGMLKRCSDPKQTSYPNYGARGIKVCKRWHTFENFLADMGRAPARHSLDRIDNEGDYEPGNCRWATAKQQHNNKRNNVYLTLNGNTHTISEWADIVGIDYGTIHGRLNKYGWDTERALTTPPNSFQHNITWNGSTRTLGEWADVLGIKRNTLWKRIYHHGWSANKAFTHPV